MQNPFESGHIKNYILFYASIVVIMVLFFIATTLFNDVKIHEKKKFDTEKKEMKRDLKEDKKAEANSTESRFKLLKNVY
jgi:amino acid permease